MHQQREAGVGVLIVVLFTSIILAVIVSASTYLALGSRQSGANEAAAFQAVLASESGQNAFIVRTKNISRYYGGTPSTCTGSDTVKSLCALNDWLTQTTNSNKVGSFTVGNSGTVTLTAVDVGYNSTTKQITYVDIQSKGSATSSEGRVLQRYNALKADIPYPYVPGAVTSYPSVQLQGGPTSIIAGTGATDAANDGIYQSLLSVRKSTNSTTAVTLSTPVTLDIHTSSQYRAAQLEVGTYVQLPLTNVASTLTGTQKGTFKVTGNTGTQVTVQPLSLPTITGGAALPSGDQNLDFVMNALVSASGNVLTLKTKESFVLGDKLAITSGTTTYTASITATSGTQVTVGTWSPSTPPSTVLTEGTVVRKSTNAVATAGSFTTGGQASAVGDVRDANTGGAALVPSPLNNVLFLKTFGYSPAEIKAMSTVYAESAFNGQVSGMVWVDSADRNVNLNNEKIEGKGILIVDGDLTVNQTTNNDCGFKGVIYVRGNLDLHGGLQLCGALVVEGSILSADGLSVTGIDSDDSDLGGNGRKVSYSPDAIMDAVAGAGPYTFSAASGTWRQR